MGRSKDGTHRSRNSPAVDASGAAISFARGECDDHGRRPSRRGVIRRFAAASAALIVFSELCACSHGSAIACEPTSRYAAAATIGPVRIPDDLNPPDETDSLRLPPDTGRSAQSNKPCLETPPGFYADGAPSNPRGGTGQRRTGTGAAPAPGPRQAAPPPTATAAPTA